MLDKEGDLLEEAESDRAHVVGREDNLVRVREGFLGQLKIVRLPFPN